MEIKIVAKKKGDLDLGLVFGGIGVFGFFGTRYFSELAALLPRCLFHHFTGLPCPTCGTTRSSILLSHFRFFDAFVANPLLVLVCFGVALWAVSALVLHILGRRMRIDHFDRAKPAVRILLIGMILANWVYLIVSRV